MDTTILFPLYDSFQAMTILSAQVVTALSGSGRLLLGAFFISHSLSLLICPYIASAREHSAGILPGFGLSNLQKTDDTL